MTIPGSVVSTDVLRARAAADPRAAVKDAARQFEAIFMQELMKSMRQATLSSGLLDNGGTKLGTELLDTEFATQMTGIPNGLSDLIARQLERQIGAAPTAASRAAAAPIGSAVRGKLVVAPAMTVKLAGLLQGGDGSPDARRGALASLTERERQILDHLARGESNKTIARALDISHDTVKLHVRHILAKLNLSSRVEAAVFAVEARVAGSR